MVALVIEGTAAAVLLPAVPAALRLSVGTALWHGSSRRCQRRRRRFRAAALDVMDFSGDAVVLLALSSCVILGSLGFPVLAELRRRVGFRTGRRQHPPGAVRHPLLLLSGTVILVLEWRASGRPRSQSPPSRCSTRFQSTICRAAGRRHRHLPDRRVVAGHVKCLCSSAVALRAPPARFAAFGVLFFVALAEIRGGAAVPVLGQQLPAPCSKAVHGGGAGHPGPSSEGPCCSCHDQSLGLSRVLFEVVSRSPRSVYERWITPTLEPFARAC
ncbi:hypothetical protein QJS66_05840 [Kocuria rhizophila]|nr:hypothetical protein QJS66_05840 [Kocuria rhizophila]